MLSRKWKLRLCMLKRTWFPHARCMTGEAIVIELTLHMIWRCDIREIILMTIVARDRRVRVLSVPVTLLAAFRCMSAREREARFIMIDGCRLPAFGRVTFRTIVIEISGDVIGIRDARKIVLVTSVAVGRRARVLPARMTIGAECSRVFIRERKPRLIMIECRGLPAVHRMALQAVMIEGTRNVIGIFRGRKTLLVAGKAIRRSAFENHIDVTFLT